MSGPATPASEALADGEVVRHEGRALEVTPSRESEVGTLRVRRALPRRARRTVGAWCFVDHMGPAAVEEGRGIDVAPHPHIGLQTVTWLFAGEILHRDSLGSEVVIRPGALNLMTAGRGVAHSEEGTGRYRGDLHGIQFWVAQPSTTRDGDPAFEHHPELPRLELGEAVATVLVGSLETATSPARRDTSHLGVDLDLRGRTTVPLDPAHEHAVVVASGAVELDGRTVVPGELAYLGEGRDELGVSAKDPSRLLLFGGTPFPERVLMWWNFVARTRDEVDAAHDAWTAGGDLARDRFGRVASPLPRITTGPPPWRSP